MQLQGQRSLTGIIIASLPRANAVRAAKMVSPAAASSSAGVLATAPKMAGARYSKEVEAACEAVRLASKLCRVSGGRGAAAAGLNGLVLLQCCAWCEPEITRTRLTPARMHALPSLIICNTDSPAAAERCRKGGQAGRLSRDGR